MQVANRTNRRYITSSLKSSTSNIRPTIKKRSNVPSVSHSSPKKVVDTPISKSNEPSTLKKLVNRFRYDEPKERPERDSVNSDFWWLHDELKTTCCQNADKDEKRKSNIPQFIDIFPSTDIDQDLNKRPSLLLDQTFSAHSSDIGHVSSTGVGSTTSTTVTSETTSTFQPIVYEQPARPIFTRIIDSKFSYKTDDREGDVLYQWRLRRRLEQGQNGEPITFPSKVTSQSSVSPTRSFFPSIPIEISPVHSPPLPVVQPLSPQGEKQQSTTTTTTNIELEQSKQRATASIPIRQYSEATTQTLQDACVQTSLTTENCLPTHDDDHHRHSSILHRPPPSRSKCELTLISSSTSPSPIKRHHRPVVVPRYPSTNIISHHQRSIIHPSNIVQSSQESTLTQVTSIMNHDDHCQERNNNSITIIDEFYEQRQDDDDDEILNILIQKRDELLGTFREIEQRLINMNS